MQPQNLSDYASGLKQDIYLFIYSFIHLFCINRAQGLLLQNGELKSCFWPWKQS